MWREEGEGTDRVEGLGGEQQVGLRRWIPDSNYPTDVQPIYVRFSTFWEASHSFYTISSHRFIQQTTTQTCLSERQLGLHAWMVWIWMKDCDGKKAVHERKAGAEGDRVSSFYSFLASTTQITRPNVLFCFAFCLSSQGQRAPVSCHRTFSHFLFTIAGGATLSEGPQTTQTITSTTLELLEAPNVSAFSLCGGAKS